MDKINLKEIWQMLEDFFKRIIDMLAKIDADKGLVDDAE